MSPQSPSCFQARHEEARDQCVALKALSSSFSSSENPLGKECVWTRALSPSRCSFSKKEEKAECHVRGRCTVSPLYVRHPCMPAHTRACQCSLGIQAEQWPQRSQRMIKAPVCAWIVGFFCTVQLHFRTRFYPTRFVRASSKNAGRR